MGIRHSRPRPPRIPDDKNGNVSTQISQEGKCKKDIAFCEASNPNSAVEEEKIIRNPIKDAKRYCAFYEPLVDVNNFKKEIKKIEEELRREENQQKGIQLKA
ncbi:unnamed protein product [Hymenolepis diminuta]|uniref:Uncharacterized protein n=1 Tax=Hymenolepis diminuta TaxID=6216 RepID=A0A0R3SCA5_HYMDI|nr:unnamed protein product [Hymenolepis diminuta]VUZ54115.1 unnamed protein product [Hymenolepis diminuta]